MTTFVSPSVDSPAVNAKGTVNPSDRPIVASDISFGSKRHGRETIVEVVESAWLLEYCSTADVGLDCGFGDCMNVPFSRSI